MKWINIKEKVPDHCGDYLCTDGKSIRLLEYFASASRKPKFSSPLYPITHWTHLPDLPNAS